MSGALRAATDVGGTFTDLVYFSTDPETGAPGDRDRASPTRRRPTSSAACSTCSRRAASRSRTSRFLAHGTTLVINAITERKGVKTGADHDRGLPRLARDRARQPARLLQPPLREAAAVRAALPAPRGAGPAHARRPASARRSTSPGCPRSSTTSAPRASRRSRSACSTPTPTRATSRRCSSASASSGRRSRSSRRTRSRREWREYERTSTAVLSAYVQPVAERYLTRLADRRPRRAASTGSSTSCSRTAASTPSSKTKEIPITMVESGPGERLLGRGRARPADRRAERARARHRRHDGEVLADRGRPREDHLRLLDRAQPPLGRLPDHGPGRRPGRDRQRRRQHRLGRRLRQAARRAAVGRRRARARRPTGAAAPRRRRPTRTSRSAASTATTSAAARSTPTWTAVDRALDAVAARLGVDRAEAARGIVRIANNNMVNALKLVSVNRGYDPRDFTLVAFGGGGGMHAVALAAELGIRQGRHPARRRRLLGVGDADERPAPRLLPHAARSPDAGERAARLEAVFDELDAAALAQFAARGRSPPGQVRLPSATAKLRYENQEHGVEVALPDGPIDAAAVARRSRTFHDVYEREYTYRLDAPVEFVGVPRRRDRRGRQARAGAGSRSPGRPLDGRVEGRARRRLRDRGRPRGRRSTTATLLEPGMRFAGPAIVETKGTTIVVHPGNEASRRRLRQPRHHRAREAG